MTTSSSIRLSDTAIDQLADLLIAVAESADDAGSEG